MHVSVRLFTNLREITGKKEETLQFPGGKRVTLNMVLTRLAKLHGKRFTDYVYEGKTKRVKGFLQFLVNGQSISTQGELDTELKDGDVVAIIPPVGGG